MAREKKRGPKLPVQQLVILAMVRFAEPLALTSVFPYLPEMIKSFGVPKEEVAKWAGMTSAVFSVSQSITAVPWGWTSDTIGRKPTIIIGLICTMICFIFWGSSTSLLMAISIRGIQGASNGNVGTIRTMVAEMVPQKALQPRAFSIMPMVWSIGSVFGPSFGGFFARPAEQFPGLFGNFQLFKTFPFLLPNLVACIFFIFSALSALLFLEETLETRKHKTDWGIELGERIIRIFRRGKPSKRSILRARARARAQARAEDRTRRLSFIDDEASAPLLSAAALQSEANLSLGGSKPATAVDESNQLAKVAAAAVASGASEVLGDPQDGISAVASPARGTKIFTYQTSMALLCYTLLALHSVAYDQVLPVFLNYPYEKHDSSNTHLPFKFSGGFGLSSGRIGTIFTVTALISGFAQFVAFPPLCTRYGPLKCFRYSSMLLPIVYILTPYSTLFEDHRIRYAAFMATFIMKGVFSIVTFPCVTIILTNSAPSVKVLGTLNGYATLVSGMGRAAGPAMTGAAFSWGVQHGYIITGWAFLAGVALLGAISTFFLEEGDGLEVPTDVAGGEEELEEDHFDSESGDLAYSYVTTDDEDDGLDDGYEEAVLRDVDQDDDEYYINGVSSRPHSSGAQSRPRGAASHSRASSRHWSTTTGVDSPLPAPTASRFNDSLTDGTVSTGSDLTLSPTQSRVPTLPKLQASNVSELREPEDPESDDPDASAATGLGLGLNDSTPTSPVRTRRFRSVSSVSRLGREDSNSAAVAMSPVVPSNSNAEREE
ncbi:hypothetical protein SEUCBS139899_009015 [Sporothrix eucalyptigena]|uniref:Major facilitator superfamily (MFS) profile domain-containing protein n=1 Tax=Sporothrix eucalyptigena TaxID=1812306 RepID=A0ABP0AKQ4_9PEZI